MSGSDDDPMAPGCYSRLLFADGIPGEYSLASISQSEDNNESLRNTLRFGNFPKCETPNSNSNNDYSVSGLQKSAGKSLVSGSVSVFQTGKKISKKPKTETRHAKVGKKERLGEKITVLQQLVSPFGKTDTASVLQEALGYVKFLQEQVQVLSSPYLQQKDEGKYNLGNRGLCLVPIEVVSAAAEPNGADLWSSSSTHPL